MIAWGACSLALGVAGSHVQGDHLDRLGAGLAQLPEELIDRGGAVALGAPYDLAADVVGDEREIAVLAPPGHLECVARYG